MPPDILYSPLFFLHNQPSQISNTLYLIHVKSLSLLFQKVTTGIGNRAWSIIVFQTISLADLLLHASCRLPWKKACPGNRHGAPDTCFLTFDGDPAAMASIPRPAFSEHFFKFIKRLFMRLLSPSWSLRPWDLPTGHLSER